MADLTESQTNELKQAFALFDKEETGTIASADLATLVRSLGEDPGEDLQEVAAELSDENGRIALDAFLGLMARRWKNTGQEEVIDAFRVFDKDGNGTVSVAELRAALAGLGERMTDEEIDQFIREADVDGDGLIDYVEFVHRVGNK